MSSWLQGEAPFTVKRTIHDAKSSPVLESKTWSFYVLRGFRKTGVFGVILVFSITSFSDHNHPEHQETTPSRFDTTLELGETGGRFNASIGL